MPLIITGLKITTDPKWFNTFEKGLKKKSTIYLNSEIANFLKKYPNWELSSSNKSPGVDIDLGTFFILLNDWTPFTPLGDTEVSYSTGLEITVEFPSQEQVYRLIPNWSQQFYLDVPGDYCFYCGAYNGPHGELRLGHDCCHCMCN